MVSDERAVTIADVVHCLSADRNADRIQLELCITTQHNTARAKAVLESKHYLQECFCRKSSRRTPEKVEFMLLSFHIMFMYSVYKRVATTKTRRPNRTKKRSENNQNSGRTTKQNELKSARTTVQQLDINIRVDIAFRIIKPVNITIVPRPVRCGRREQACVRVLHGCLQCALCCNNFVLIMRIDLDSH